MSSSFLSRIALDALRPLPQRLAASMPPEPHRPEALGTSGAGSRDERAFSALPEAGAGVGTSGRHAQARSEAAIDEGASEPLGSETELAFDAQQPKRAFVLPMQEDAANAGDGLDGRSRARRGMVFQPNEPGLVAAPEAMGSWRPEMTRTLVDSPSTQGFQSPVISRMGQLGVPPPDKAVSLSEREADGTGEGVTGSSPNLDGHHVPSDTAAIDGISNPGRLQLPIEAAREHSDRAKAVVPVTEVVFRSHPVLVPAGGVDAAELAGDRSPSFLTGAESTDLSWPPAGPDRSQFIGSAHPGPGDVIASGAMPQAGAADRVHGRDSEPGEGVARVARTRFHQPGRGTLSPGAAQGSFNSGEKGQYAEQAERSGSVEVHIGRIDVTIESSRRTSAPVAQGAATVQADLPSRLYLRGL